MPKGLRWVGWLTVLVVSAGCRSSSTSSGTRPTIPSPNASSAGWHASKPARTPPPATRPKTNGVAALPAPARLTEPISVVQVPEDLIIAPAQPIVPEPLITTVPPPASAWPSNWLRGWLPLETWCEYNRLPAPARLTGNPSVYYEVPTTNGPLQVRLGQRALRFAGFECWLSHAPEIIRGQACVHALDAQKTLQPLLALESRPATGGRVIVLDPGHGGRDAGALSRSTGESEKHYTLDWALRLRRLLVTNGWTVWLTRTNDLELTLPDRVAFAERVGADLFLSLHFNSGNNGPDRTGIETYCLTPAGLPSNVLRTQEDDSRQLFPNNTFDEQNVQWAFRFHRATVSATGAVDHGVRRARFMAVLRGQNRPAVLLEGGYLSNPVEARRIATAEYRQLLAEGVADALK